MPTLSLNALAASYAGLRAVRAQAKRHASADEIARLDEVINELRAALDGLEDICGCDGCKERRKLFHKLDAIDEAEGMEAHTVQ